MKTAVGPFSVRLSLHSGCFSRSLKPGGFHFGVLPPAGVTETVGLAVDVGVLEAAGLPAGGVLTGVEADETNRL